MSEPICAHCQKPVVVNAEMYETFERMHWLCFHLNFEHEGDPDQACQDPSCPWNRITSEKLEAYEEAIRVAKQRATAIEQKAEASGEWLTEVGSARLEEANLVAASISSLKDSLVEKVPS